MTTLRVVRDRVEAPRAKNAVVVGLRTSAEDWAKFGRCRGMDINVFFGLSPTEILVAKSVCRNCLVRTSCLDEALGDPRLRGVWGGTSEAERRSLRLRR